MKHAVLQTILLLMLCLGSLHVSAATAADPLPDYARKYIAEKLFDGVEPADSAIDAAVEVLTIPQVMTEYISQNDWERGQLAMFSSDKLHLLVACPDGTVHNLVFRDGKKRKDQVVDEPRVRIMKRLYDAELFNTAPDAILQPWLDVPDLSADVQFEAAMEMLAGLAEFSLDGQTLERARSNFFAVGTNTDELARALGALMESEYAEESCWAAIWLISRMDKMSFRRENKVDSVSDLSAVDAQLFYENVFYAVKARNEFVTGMGVSDVDFLQQVLSPRLTGEPLQRWRRHFFLALEPEVGGLSAEDASIAVGLASSAYGNVFQYEGDTTWEDFGMLTALSVLEGRCEDCSNVNNAMLRTIGVPGCQAYTPWWGHQDGNHAWTWTRGVGNPPGDGKNGVKVYVKTWDGNEDVTAEYSPVTTIEFATDSTTDEPVKLMVWNHDEWRKITSEKVSDGKVTFKDVGRRLNQSLCIRIEGEPDHVADLRKDGSFRWLNLETKQSDEVMTVQVDYDKTTPFGEMKPDEDYELIYYSVDGWQATASERASTGGLTFEAQTDRLYRITGPGIASRPFTVELDDDSGEVVTLRR